MVIGLDSSAVMVESSGERWALLIISPMTENQEAFDAILHSAREEIMQNGILGLRVADVAAAANTSITQIYRFFRNRDGLLAKVLGDIYDEQSQMSVDAYLARLPAKNDLTIDDLVGAVPLVMTEDQVKFHELRLQILATSIHNPDLRKQLKLCTQNLLEIWTTGLAGLQQRMASGEKFDERVFLMHFAQLNPYYRTLIDDRFFTPEEYREFLREKMRA
jgi:AcrR family transcriptional regulator